jgi:hypothetical protein
MYKLFSDQKLERLKIVDTHNIYRQERKEGKREIVTKDK